jgi:HEAT repeat protein
MSKPAPAASPDDDSNLRQLLQDLQNDAFWVRERAAEALGRHASPEAIAALQGALDDATATVRERAAEALGRIGSDPALAGLADALGERQASETLARLGAHEAVARLQHVRTAAEVERLRQDLRHSLYERRWDAAQALWALQGAPAVEALLQALRESSLPGQPQIEPRPLADGPDEYIIFDALSRREFQAAWNMARDLVRMDAEYGVMVCERVLDLNA